MFVADTIPTSDVPLIFSIVGGAAGVGKSRLLNEVIDAEKLSTGTLFSSHMSLASRDEVRSNDWSVFEAIVTEDLKTLAIEALSSGRLTILDTHFAAKLNGKNYRIGLKNKLIHELATHITSFAHTAKRRLLISVILINCDVHDLLDRRRLDKTRNRELIPSDCYNGLRQNWMFGKQYFMEAIRAKNALEGGHCEVSFSVIENDVLDDAVHQLKTLLSREK